MSAGSPGHDERLPRMFAGIVVVEVIVILALFWAGRYFGS